MGNLIAAIVLIILTTTTNYDTNKFLRYFKIVVIESKNYFYNLPIKRGGEYA